MRDIQLSKLANKLKNKDHAKKILAFLKLAQQNSFDVEYENYTGQTKIISVDPSSYRKSRNTPGYGSVMPLKASPNGKHHTITLADARIKNLKDFEAVRSTKPAKPKFTSPHHKLQVLNSTRSAPPAPGITRIEYNGTQGPVIIDLVTSTINSNSSDIQGEAHPTQQWLRLEKSRCKATANQSSGQPNQKLCKHEWVDTGLPNGKTWCKLCDIEGQNNQGHISVAKIRKARITIARLLKRLK